jgi:hypothetical protein
MEPIDNPLGFMMEALELALVLIAIAAAAFLKAKL